MTAGKVLYTRDILALAVSLADWPLAEDLVHEAELRSQSCGSVVRVGLDVATNGTIARFGVAAQACALGQASAALLAAHARGQDRATMARAYDALAAFLAGQRGDPGDWPGVEHLASALPYPARHGSILLPWRAVLSAMDGAELKGMAGAGDD